MADKAYYVATINYGNHLNPLSEKQVAEFLLQADSCLSQIQFHWVRMNQPPAGSCFLVILPAVQREVPEDGYLWQDFESVKRLNLNQYIIHREQGYKPGESSTSVCKRRYRLLNTKNQLQFVHYLSVDYKHRQPVIQANPAASKLHQQQAHFAQYQQQQLQQQQQRMKRMSSSAAVVGPDLSDMRFIGDDMDQITVRDLATVRYKRNHHYLSELFSPFSVSDIVKESKPLFNKDATEHQKKKLADLEAEIQSLESQHQLRVKSVKEPSKKIHAAISSVIELQSGEAVKEHLEQISSELGLRAIPAARVMRVNMTRDPNQMQTVKDSRNEYEIALDDLVAA